MPSSIDLAQMGSWIINVVRPFCFLRDSMLTENSRRILLPMAKSIPSSMKINIAIIVFSGG